MRYIHCRLFSEKWLQYDFESYKIHGYCNIKYYFVLLYSCKNWLEWWQNTVVDAVIAIAFQPFSFSAPHYNYLILMQNYIIDKKLYPVCTLIAYSPVGWDFTYKTRNASGMRKLNSLQVERNGMIRSGIEFDWKRKEAAEWKRKKC